MVRFPHHRASVKCVCVSVFRNTRTLTHLEFEYTHFPRLTGCRFFLPSISLASPFLFSYAPERSDVHAPPFTRTTNRSLARACLLVLMFMMCAQSLRAEQLGVCVVFHLAREARTRERITRITCDRAFDKKRKVSYAAATNFVRSF